jgi:hypothetical protein
MAHLSLEADDAGQGRAAIDHGNALRRLGLRSLGLLAR